LFGTDNPGAEVRFQWSAVFGAVLDDSEVLDLGRGQADPGAGDNPLAAGPVTLDEADLAAVREISPAR
jgi:hypothetical protein